MQLWGLSVQLRLDRRLLQLHHAHRHLHVQQWAGVQWPRVLRVRPLRVHPAQLLRRHLREVPHLPRCLHHQEVRESRGLGQVIPHCGLKESWDRSYSTGELAESWGGSYPIVELAGLVAGTLTVCSSVGLGLLRFPQPETERCDSSTRRAWRSSWYLPPLPQGLRRVQEV